MSNYRPYPKYKPSGVEWLGDVPEHWKASRIGRLSSTGMGQTILREMLEDVPSADALPVYSASEAEAEFGYFMNPSIRLTSGDLVVGARGSIGLTRRISAPSTCTQTTIWVKPIRSQIDSAYLYWCMIGGREQLFPFDKTAIPMLTVEQVRSGGIPIPPLSEQHQIATFLDRECGKLDALQAKQERLIELLKEKRQALISHAVTRGLDPTAKLKPSGVEWLGEVPEGWRVTRLSFSVNPSTSITYGIVQAGPHVEDGIPYIRTGDMSGSSLPDREYPKTSHEIDRSYQRSKVFAGDIVMAIRATVGKALPLPDFLDGANLTQGTAKISPGKLSLRDFLLYSFAAGYCQAQFEIHAKGATFKEITLEMLRNLAIVLPPLAEQRAIVAHLDEKCGKIDQLKAKAERGIELLKERRSALISAVVTGKIDIRDHSS
jgi:type I restriction enzyme S subunit